MHHTGLLQTSNPDNTTARMSLELQHDIMNIRHLGLFLVVVFLNTIDLSKGGCEDYFSLDKWSAQTKNLSTEMFTFNRTNDYKYDVMCTLLEYYSRNRDLYGGMGDILFHCNCSKGDDTCLETLKKQCEPPLNVSKTVMTIHTYHFMCMAKKLYGVPIEESDFCNYPSWMCESSRGESDRTSPPSTSTSTSTSTPPSTSTSPSTSPPTSTSTSPPTSTSPSTSPPKSTSPPTSTPQPTTKTTTLSTTTTPQPPKITIPQLQPTTAAPPPPAATTTTATPPPQTITTTTPTTTATATTTATTPEDGRMGKRNEQEGRASKVTWIVLVLVIVLALVAFALYKFTQRRSERRRAYNEAQPSETPTTMTYTPVSNGNAPQREEVLTIEPHITDETDIDKAMETDNISEYQEDHL